MTNKKKIGQILFCNCIFFEIIDQEIKEKVRGLLSQFDVEVIMVADLCKTVVKNENEIDIIKNAKNIIILACHKRAVISLFDYANIVNKGNIEILNMCNSQTIQQLEEGLSTFDRKENKLSDISDIKVNEGWIPWFPIIDYSRCSNCKQCFSFCLFDTYGLDNQGKVIVKNPENCKPNCPACARICPQTAIIFPKSPESPINGKTIVDEEQMKTSIKLNIDKMFGGDIYSTLEKRRNIHRKKLLRQKAVEQALKERQECSVNKVTKWKR